MRVNNEAQFQKWFIGTFLPVISEGTVIVSDGNNRNGVSDISWMVPGCGVFAIELKYTKILDRGPNSKVLHSHKLSSLQALFLKRWADATTDRHSIVVIGTDYDEVLFYTGDIVRTGNVNDILIAERHKLSSYNIPSVVGKSRRAIQQSPLYEDGLQAIRDNMFGGDFDVEE